MSILKAFGAIVILLAAPSVSADQPGGSSRPQDLADRLSAAYESGDVDGAVALLRASTRDVILNVYLDTLKDCFAWAFSGSRCAVNISEIPDELRDEATHYHPAPLGVVRIAVPPSAAKVEAGNAVSTRNKDRVQNRVFFYSKFDNAYAIYGFDLPPERIREVGAMTAQEITDRMLTRGPYLPSGRDPLWKSRAQHLPAGGGEPGSALIERTRGMMSALRSGDVDSAVKAGGGGRYLDGSTDAGKSPSAAQRKVNLHVHMLEHEMADLTILGGYQLDDIAVLIVDGHSCLGDIERGYYLMKRVDGSWTFAGKETYRTGRAD